MSDVVRPFADFLDAVTHLRLHGGDLSGGGNVVDHEAATNPHPQYATDSDLTAHAGDADPHTVYQRESEKGMANGYASLDSGGTIPDAQIPSTITRDSELTAAVNAVIDAAPGALDTLNELAAALGDDPNFATTITTALAGKSNTGHTHSYEPSGTVATHAAAADPHTGYQKESEKGAANGYASLSASSLVPTGQLGTGTADSSTYLRGDGTWASAGGGADIEGLVFMGSM